MPAFMPVKKYESYTSRKAALQPAAAAQNVLFMLGDPSCLGLQEMCDCTDLWRLAGVKA